MNIPKMVDAHLKKTGKSFRGMSRQMEVTPQCFHLALKRLREGKAQHLSVELSIRVSDEMGIPFAQLRPDLHDLGLRLLPP